MDQQQKNWLIVIAVVLLLLFSNKQSGCTIIKPVDPVDPVVNPVSSPKMIFIFWESGNSTRAMGRLMDDLRSGEALAYLKSKSHELQIIDVDQKDAAGQPNPFVNAWKEQISDPLPVMLIVNKVTDTKTGVAQMELKHKESLPVSTVKWQAVIELVKAHGG